MTRRPPFLAALILAFAPAWVAAAQPPLTTPEAIHRLSNVEAAKGLPVAFEATVTYFNGYRKILTVQDGSTGIYVKATTSAALTLGDRVLVKGVTQGGYLPFVISNDISLLGHGTLPKPAPATFDEMIRARYDSVLVTTRGEVRSANMDAPSASHSSGATLRILTDGGAMDVEVNSGDPQTLAELLDAEVNITGVAGARFDGKRQQTGVVLHLSSLADIKVVKPATVSPWSLPVTPMDHVLDVYRVMDLSSRVKVTGVVTYYFPGTAVVLQSGTSSLWINTSSFAPLHIGDQAEATGFPSVGAGFPELVGGEVRDLGVGETVSPLAGEWQELTSGQHMFDLVSIEGQVVTAIRGRAQDEYVLVADGYEFSAIYRHPAGAMPESLAPMKPVQIGSRIRVTGVCVQDEASSYDHTVHSNILLRSPDDIAVLAGAPWLNVDHLMLLAGVLLLVVLALGAREWYLERVDRRQIVTLAYVEQRRSRILEEINHSKPLAGILERVTELVSLRLQGAPCWCEISDGATLGNRPAQLPSASLRTVEYQIAARSGPPLGKLSAAFDANTKPSNIEKEALGVAAELATLAIETARLYSDLVHRSEHDVLTDVQNRFAMEKTLRAQIHAARKSAGILGLIYIDLNEFKQVNDVYGHQAGDTYLQELTLRFKGQLRPGDTLARLGGDEFAVLVTEVRNRAKVEEIAARLEHCFDEPFLGNGYVVKGSASIGIAVYPDDAGSADSLLRAADAAMYVNKYTRPGRSRAPEPQLDADLAPEDRT